MAEGIKTSGFARSKVKGWADLWRRAQKAYESANGAAMEKLKEAKEDIRTAADQIGIKKTVWNKAMKKLDLMRQADDLRSFEDTAMTDQFDSVMLALGVKMIDDEAEPEKEKPGDDKKEDGPETDRVKQIAREAGADFH